LLLHPLLRMALAGGLVLWILGLGGCTTATEAPSEPTVIPVYPPPPEQPRYIYEKTIRSSLDVVKEDSTSAFRRFATGEQQRGEGFAKPFDIVVHRGRMFVGDTVRRTVMVFDPAGMGRFFELGREEPGRLFLPLGIAKDRDGNIYVCDGTAKRVVIYNRDGRFLRAVGGQKYFSRPSGVAVDPDGSRVFVVDTGGVDSPDHHVLVFDAITGKLINTIGRRGTGDGEFNLPRDAVISHYNNLLYVVDGGNFRVQVFTMDGKFVRKFGSIGRRSGQFARPKGITVDRWGNVYVVDAAFGNVQIFDPDGRLLMFIGARGNQDRPGAFMLPAGVDIDEADGRLYLVDQFFRKVEVFRPTEHLRPATNADTLSPPPAEAGRAETTAKP